MKKKAVVNFFCVIFNKIEDLVLWGRIFTLICQLPLLFRLLNIQPLLKLLTPKKSDSAMNSDREEKIIKWTDTILGWNFFIFRTSCLKRSLVLYHFLKQSGLPLQINFGVRKAAKNVGEQWPLLAGHGWLSLSGQTYLEKNEPLHTFKLIYSFPPLQQAGQ